jgi:gluconokinase
MIIVLMGVSGSGKTVVGRELAQQLDWAFVDGDDLHPSENVEKMARGEPLNDADRAPWLRTLMEIIDDLCRKDISIVLACSALKESYRTRLGSASDCIEYVHLTGSPELIAERLSKRKGHYMPPSLLKSQFDTLEPPVEAIEVDVTPAPPAIADEIRERLDLGAE